MKISYKKGVRYIAFEDEPHEMDASAMSGYASVHVLAEAFGKTEDQVAADVIRERRKELRRERSTRRVTLP